MKICNKTVLSKLLFYLKKLAGYDLGDQYEISHTLCSTEI